MSRFSKSEAEARGWVFVHERDDFDVTTSETQGETRHAPPTIRAEKTVNGQNVSMEGETLGLLLERIASYEAHLESFPDVGPDALPLSGLPRDQAGFPLRTVRTDHGDFTEEEWSQRARRNDVIVTEEGQQHFSGATIEGAPIADLDAAIEERLRDKHDRESRRAADVREEREVEQVEVDTSRMVDSPGVGAGGILRIPADTDLDELDEQRQRESHELESERVRDTDEGLGRLPSPEDEDDLAGVDVGLGRRGDLGSEIPPQGHTPEFVEGEQERIAEEREAGLSVVPSVTADAAEAENQARLDAQEAKAKEIRDEKGAAAADKPEGVAEVQEAGAEAAQEQADQFTEEDDVEATDAAIATAKEKGVDLSEVKGSGKDGRVTKPDVEAAADEQDPED